MTESNRATATGKQKPDVALERLRIGGGGYTEMCYEKIVTTGVRYLLPELALLFAMRRLMARGLAGLTRGLESTKFEGSIE